MNQSQLFPPCSKAISGTKKEIGLSVTGAAQVEQTLLWERATLPREAVARAGIGDNGWKGLAADYLLVDTEILC